MEQDHKDIKNNSEKPHHHSNTESDNKLFSFFKKIHWETWVLMAALLVLIVSHYNLLSQLNQLPSPIFGGDYYNHLGSINHIYQGGSVFQSGQMLGEIQWVPFLYHILVVIFAKITGLAPLFANIYFSLIALVLGCIIIYIFISKFFQNRIFGLLAAILHAINFPVYKYSPFAFYVTLPLFYLAGYNFLKKKDWKSALLFGGAYGICGLSNTYVFIISTFFVGIFLFYFVFLKNFQLNLSESTIAKKFSIDKKNFLKGFYLGLIIFFVGFAIALLWWFKPIFVYHAHTLNDMQVYGFPEVKGFGGMLNLVGQGLKTEFIGYNFKTDLGETLKRIGLVLGLLCLIFIKKKKEEHEFILIALAAAAVGLLIHFITVPLLGTLMASQGIFNTGLIVTNVLLTFLVLEIIIHYARSIHIGTRQYAEYAVILVFTILVIVSVGQRMAAVQNDYWWATGKGEISPMFTEAQSWVLQNTELNDVFLTTNEDGFALNALTGRKVVTYRRTHSSPYADMNQRMLDSGIMLYAQNDVDRVALLKKYSVDYVYWEPRWMANEFSFDSSGKVQGFFDPLSADYSPEREAYLTRNNASFIKTSWYLDPAWLPTYPKRDLLIVMPGRASYETPWSASLDKYLVLEKEIIIGGQLAGRIYKVTV